MPLPPGVVPLPYQVYGVAGVKSRLIPSESFDRASENVPPSSGLVNPLAPAVGSVLILNSVGSKPEIAPPLVRIRHEPAVEGSKDAALPLTSGLVEASDQRLTLNGFEEDSAESVSDAELIRSQPLPAVPAASRICQL